MPFGKQLKNARISKRMTQEELASAVGVTKGAIGNYESEVSSPKEQILIQLMKVLDIDPNYLYQDYISPSDTLSDDERHLLSAYRAADDRAREDAMKTLLDHPRQRITTKESAM